MSKSRTHTLFAFEPLVLGATGLRCDRDRHRGAASIAEAANTPNQNEAVSELLFTEHSREHRPLRRALDQWSNTAWTNARNINKRQFDLADNDGLLDHLLEEFHRQAALPLARVDVPRLVQEPLPTDRRDLDGPGRYPVHQWRAQFQILGNLAKLTYWPDAICEEPASSNLHFWPIDSMPVWQASDRGPIATIDVPRSDDPGGREVPTAAISAAAAYLDAVIEAVNTEVAAYSASLRENLRNLLDERREYLGAIGAQNDALIELLRLPTPELEVVEVRSSHRKETLTGEEVHLGRKLSATSFAELLSVVRKWGAGATRYSPTFSKLKEEDISGLLVTTLNVAFDTAHREVFSNGKTDIYVESISGDRTNVAFFGEAKIWSGQVTVAEDLTQAFGYASGATNELMLLYYVKNFEFESASSRCLEAVAEYPSFVKWAENGHGHIAVASITHPDFGQAINVAVLFIHLPAGRRSRRSK